MTILLAASTASWAQDEPAFAGPVIRALGLDGRPVARETRRGITRTRRATPDETLSLTIDSTACEPARCAEAMRLALDYLNRMATGQGGRLLAVSDSDLQAEWRSGAARTIALVQRFPAAVLFWTVKDGRVPPTAPDPVLALARSGANGQRANDLADAPDAVLTPWVDALHEHAGALRAAGETDAALGLLRRLAAAAPRRFDILADLAGTETSPDAARAVARVVLEQAEDSKLRQRAAVVLQISLPTLAALPVIAPGRGGLRLVLIALPPCDASLLADAARIYERMTGIPTEVVRLDGDWDWGVEQRFLGQLMVLDDLRKQRGDKLDTTGWDRARIMAALRTPPPGVDAFTRYSLEQSARAVADAPAQYDVTAQLARLRERVAPARQDDRRVMYVAVTEMALHTPETHFVFSQSEGGAMPLGIVSTAMMLARPVSGGEEPFRVRLVERLAKELVPASLAQLGIPQPTDPSDLYAPTNSVAQLQAKGLSLSAPTREALEAIRAGR